MDHHLDELGERRFRAIAEQSSELLMTVDENRVVQWANAAFERVLGYPVEELVGQDFFPLVFPDDLPALVETIGRLSTTAGASGEVSFRVRSASGAWHWMETSATNLFHEPAVAGFVVSLRDVSERYELERKFERLAEHAPDIVIRFDRELRHLYVNPAVEAATGFPPEHFLGRTNRELGAPEEQCALWERELGAVFESGRPRRFEFELAGEHGMRWFEAHVVPDENSGGPIETILSFTRDRTDAHRAEERYRDLFERAPDGVFATDLEGRLVSVNPAAEQLTGFSRDELLSMHVFDLVPPEEADRLRELLSRRLAGGTDEPVEVELVAKHGRPVFVELRGHVVGGEDGRGHVEGIARDTTERHLLEEELRHRVFHDELTELPNRALLLDRLAQALARAERSESEVAVLLLDIDDFKLVNDSLGHAAGDELLVEFAGRLRSTLRGSETIARLGGDEFALVAEGIKAEHQVVAIARRVQSAFSEPFTVGEGERRLTGSVGIVLAAAGATPQDLLRDADTAMYRAKATTKGGFVFFDAAVRAELLRRLEISEALQDALRDQALEVHYQPIVSLADDQIVAVEALVRWRRLGHWMPPDEFIPIAEENGLIVPLGRHVVDVALEQAARWRARDPRALPQGMFVNVSPRELSQRGYAAFVIERVAEHGLTGADLALELTERTLVDDRDRALVENLDQLGRAGVRLILDDFGTGYSALASLKRFPLAAVKIDRYFIQAISSPDAHAPITRAIIGLGEAVGILVIAEGVETEMQLAYLRRLGCDAAQGYHLGRPQPARGISALFSPDSGLVELTS